MPKDPRLERFVLRVSVFGSLFFAIAGIIVGYLLSSTFILFDGVYSFLSVIMSWISLRAGVCMLTSDKRFPFGKSTIESLIILFQYGVHVRTTKSGNLLFIEIDLVVAKDYPYDKIAEQDRIRQKIEDALAFLPYGKWLTISFTQDNRWAE
ncbi:cation efflux protein [Exiguobacterium sp. S17]|nr:cation efflux protein [Exiguobacterium sp. S17]